MLIANIPFEDLEKGVHREQGERFSCSDERGKYLVSCGIVEAVNGEPEQPEDSTEDPVTEDPATKKPARKTSKK